MKKISCIIPAYNEEKNIAQVLSVVTPFIGSTLHEVIVVDDKSKDTTKEIVRTFSTVQLVEHEINQGKSSTVADGIAVATGEFIFLLDADLIHLNAQNIIDILEPMQQGLALMTISYRKNAWPLFPFTRIDYLSGERVLPRVFLQPLLIEMGKLESYGLEVFLNRATIAQQLSIAVVQWPNVENDFHYHKHGIVKGVLNIIKIWGNVLSTISIIEMYTQNIRLQKLIIK